MRQKNVKIATKEYLESCGVVTTLCELPSYEKSFLEVGSGKGEFFAKMALDFKDIHFFALEVNPSICYRIFEKKRDLNLSNLTIILGDANHLPVYFKDKSIHAIYLNFSDPWPKTKHHKRRLTYPTFLDTYKKLLKEDGFIQFRTDHKDLFNDSLSYMSKDFLFKDINYNLEPSIYMTEYEIKKRPYGPIYQLIGKVKKHD
jgi:tRNA (guanine-N7-)-methyltransferase